jgi:hypothetical protein
MQLGQVWRIHVGALTQKAGEAWPVWPKVVDRVAGIHAATLGNVHPAPR